MRVDPTKYIPDQSVANQFNVGADGSVVIPPYINPYARALITGDILLGAYRPTWNFDPKFVNLNGDGSISAWSSSVWTCTAGGAATFRMRISSAKPGAGLNGGTDVIDITTPTATFIAGNVYNIIIFTADDSLPVSDMQASGGGNPWTGIVFKNGGGSTFIPGALGVGGGVMLVQANG